MDAQEKLQRAIEATIAAGYQLNSEAFEFLSQNAEANDPENFMALALQKIESLQDKPMFIEKCFLEAVLQATMQTPQLQATETQYESPMVVPQPQLRPLKED